LSNASPILVFQHMPADHPGYLFDRLRSDGIPFEILRLDLFEPIPDLRNYSAIWVLGGPMDVWEEEKHPWLIPEKNAIRQAVLDLNMPYFGVCLGHQLLAEAIGGNVGKAEKPEIGVVDVDLNRDGQDHAMLGKLPMSVKLLQWHLAEVKEVPGDVTVLASSTDCAVHGISRGGHVLGLQSHIEVSLASVQEWLAVPEARAQLEEHLGQDAVTAFAAEIERQMPKMNKAAAQLYPELVAVIENS